MGGIRNPNPTAGLDRAIRRQVRNLIDWKSYEAKAEELTFIGLENVLRPPEGTHWFRRAVWAVIITTSVTLCIYQLWDRIEYYFTYPIAYQVLLERKENITFPNLILCGERSIVLDRKRAAAKFNKDPCSFIPVDFIDVAITGKDWTVDRVWQKKMSMSGVFNKFTIATQVPRFNVPAVDWEFSEIPAPWGACAMAKPVNSSTEYYGTLSMMAGLMNLMMFCVLPRITFSYRDDYFDPSSMIDIPVEMIKNFALESKEFRALDIPGNPCVPDEEHWDCILMCLSNQLMAHPKICRLPYMRNVTKPDCRTSKEGRMAHFTALRLMRKSNLHDTCGCPRSCIEQSVSVKLEVYDVITYAVFTYFPTNFMQVTQEVRSYPVAALLSDVGGNLGLFLGFCVLSLVDSLQLLFDTVLRCCSKLNNTPKQPLHPQFIK